MWKEQARCMPRTGWGLNLCSQHLTCRNTSLYNVMGCPNFAHMLMNGAAEIGLFEVIIIVDSCCILLQSCSVL